MKIGVCTSPDHLPLLAEQGYDYFETGFNWIINLDEAEFRAQSAIVEKYALAAEAFNGFFRGGTKMYAPDGNQDAILREIAAYAEKGFARAAAWGGEVAVFGCGSARGLREDMSREETDRQFARVLAVCGEAAERHGMRVAIEPLSKSECNYIHTVEEGAALAKLTGQAAVGVLVDFYHHAKNEDDLDALPLYADLLYHTHYARPVDRGGPEEEDRGQLLRLAEILKSCPKAKRISLECKWYDDFDGAVRRARPLMEIFH